MSDLLKLAKLCEDSARFNMSRTVHADSGVDFEAIDRVILDLDRAEALRRHASMSHGEKQ